MSITPLIGRPGISSARTAAPRNVFKSADFVRYYENGGTLDGAKCRDGDNTDNILLLRAGVLMGKVTSSKKWAPSIIGVMKTSALTSTGTSITINAAQAVELVRRVGTTGTFKLTGPPAAAGTVRTVTATYSAVDTTTGVVTITALGVNEVQTLTFGAAATGGTMRLRVPLANGTLVTTDAITWNATDATWLAAINTALDAATGVAGGIVATGAAPDTAITFTYSGTGYANLPQPDAMISVNTFPTSTTTATVVRTTTGVDGRFIIGSFVQPTDGSNAPLTVIPDGFGVLMAVDSSDVDWPQIPTQGPIVGSQLLPAWPSDTSLQAWIKAALCPANGGPRFSFDDVFSGV